MAHLHLESETDLSPEQVITALTDFSPRRAEIWPYLEAEFYEIISVEENSASIREGSAIGPIKIWSKERYQWSPRNVRYTIEESNFCKPGGYVDVTATEREGGGSKLHVEWERVAANMKGHFVVTAIKLTKGKALMDAMKKGLSNYARPEK